VGSKAGSLKRLKCGSLNKSMQHTLINIISAGKSQFAKWLRKLKPTSGKKINMRVNSNQRY
jgi:hypothetical protein